MAYYHSDRINHSIVIIVIIVHSIVIIVNTIGYHPSHRGFVPE